MVISYPAASQMIIMFANIILHNFQIYERIKRAKHTDFTTRHVAVADTFSNIHCANCIWIRVLTQSVAFFFYLILLSLPWYEGFSWTYYATTRIVLPWFSTDVKRKLPLAQAQWARFAYRAKITWPSKLYRFICSLLTVAITTQQLNNSGVTEGKSDMLQVWRCRSKSNPPTTKH
jgi:hypothetical protein